MYVLLQVKAGSKAEALGVRPGDVVHSINDQSTSKLTLSDAISLVYGHNSSHSLTLQLSTYTYAIDNLTLLRPREACKILR